MPIVSSAVIADQAQADGRRWIQERHTDQIGKRYEAWYLAPAVWDKAAALAARAVTLAAEITNGEIGDNIAQVTSLGSVASLKSVYSTAAQAQTALRTAYASASRVEAVMVGDFLSSLTNAQLQTLFSMTAGQVTTLRSNRLTPAATAATSIRSAAGQ